MLVRLDVVLAKNLVHGRLADAELPTQECRRPMGVPLRRCAHHRRQDFADGFERHRVAPPRLWPIGKSFDAALLEAASDSAHLELRQAHATSYLDARNTVGGEKHDTNPAGVSLLQRTAGRQLLELAALLLRHRERHGSTHNSKTRQTPARLIRS
jgi:hypothetical protein